MACCYKDWKRTVCTGGTRDVVAKKKWKSPKEALKSTVQKSVKNQVGCSRARIGGVRGGNVHKKQKRSVPDKSRKIIQRKELLLFQLLLEKFLFQSEK